MKLVVQVKLTPSPGQAAALEATLRACNDAANRVSEVAFAAYGLKARNYDLRKLAYAALREDGLGSQAAQHVIKKVCDAYATLRGNIRAGNLGRPGSARRVKAESKPIAFRPDAAQPFDQRNLSFSLDARTISIWALGGRLKDVPFACSPGQLKTLSECPRGEADLFHRDGMWFLAITVDVPEVPLNEEPAGFLGVDLGIVNIATASDGKISAGRGLNRHRARQLDLRRKLQAKGTKSAKRVLKRRSRKEQRFATDANYRIAKTIVSTAERTGRGIALEDLSGIRDRVRLRKHQRTTLHSWAFHQLGQFIAYKAKLAGVPVVFVDPAYTSQECSGCHHIDRRNRPNQATFTCRACGLMLHADVNGSRTIAHRGAEAWTRAVRHAAQDRHHAVPDAA